MYGALIACSALALFSWKTDIFSAPASFIAFVIGVVISILNGFSWLLLLLSFMFIGYAGTKWKFDWKKEMGLEESGNGCRKLKNILGNGTAATFFAITVNPVAFSGAVATALSDTLASEIGVFSENSKLITNFSSVKRGTNGAVSPLGTLLSAVGSGAIALLGYFLLSVNPVAPFIGGFVGCNIDSVLGATLERKGYLSKSLVNLIATFSGGFVALSVTML